VIMGTIMYIVEGGENGFTSIPRSIYWAIVTMTTVGFGDIHPHTDLGQFFSVILMILGYGIIAVPTGIVGVEMFKDPNNVSTSSGNSIILENTHCHNCGRTGHLPSSNFCMQCGSEL
ncbi:MAG: potassium channel family protein, partial [Salibacteraceae bacterium]|nr:potassium channel family protein [Salibacteraceae bacterium]